MNRYKMPECYKEENLTVREQLIAARYEEKGLHEARLPLLLFGVTVGMFIDSCLFALLILLTQ